MGKNGIYTEKILNVINHDFMKSFMIWIIENKQEDFVKDKNGMPQVFYHGTNANFSKFNRAK